MKPNGQKKATDTERNFAYRLPHFRRISENTFGIWSKHFSAKAQLTPKKAALNIMASIALIIICYVQSLVNHTHHMVLLTMKLRELPLKELGVNVQHPI